jgi:hypothetical protein
MSVYGPLLGCKLAVSLAFDVRLLTYLRLEASWSVRPAVDEKIMAKQLREYLR